MTDPELHPLPITPNDPLSIVSKLIYLNYSLHFALIQFHSSKVQYNASSAYHQRSGHASQNFSTPSTQAAKSAKHHAATADGLHTSPTGKAAASYAGQGEEDRDEFDMEISNTESNPNSMFKSALPSLKLNIESKLSPGQRSQLEKKRADLQSSLSLDMSDMSAAVGKVTR